MWAERIMICGTKLVYIKAVVSCVLLPVLSRLSVPTGVHIQKTNSLNQFLFVFLVSKLIICV